MTLPPPQMPPIPDPPPVPATVTPHLDEAQAAKLRGRFRTIGRATKDKAGAAGRSVKEGAGTAGRSVKGRTDIVGQSIAGGVARLYDRAMDAILATPHDVHTRDEAMEMLKGDAESEAVASQVQKLALVLTPIVRRFAVTKKVPGLRRVPAAAIVISTASVAAALRDGVRDVQVVGSYLAGRIELETGRAADPRLVKKATADLYVHPGRPVRITDRKVHAAGLLRVWLTRGFLGWDLSKPATKAIDAVARCDVDRIVREWEALPALPR